MPPTRAELLAAHGKRVPDLIGPDLLVLFCGINPSLYSAAVGYHFARPGNRFYKTLMLAGFTDRVLAPHEQGELLLRGIGITNLVARATASASELEDAEYRRGARTLAKKLREYRPGALAFLGIDAYRIASGRRDVRVGRQAEPFHGFPCWVLPNPSGLNAHYQQAALAAAYAELARAGLSR